MHWPLNIINLALYAAAAGLLVRRYLRERRAGWLWLILALAVLPALAVPGAVWLYRGAAAASGGRPPEAFPFTLVRDGTLSVAQLLLLADALEHLVWGICALSGLLLLNRRRAPGGADPDDARAAGRRRPNRERAARSP